MKDFERGNHRDEDPKKHGRHFRDRMEGEVIGLMKRAWRRVPGQQRHRQHDRLLYSTRPSQVTAQYRCRHHSEQIKDVYRSANLEAAPRLDLLDHVTVRFLFLLQKQILIQHIERDQQEAHRERPVRQQGGGKKKRYAAKKPKEWRIAERNEQPADISDEENKEYNQVCFVAARVIGANIRTN